MTTDGVAYFLLWDQTGPGIYRSSLEDGSFTTPVSLGEPVNTSFPTLGPLVAPDESYLIFASNRPGGFGDYDLWITFHHEDGTWSEPINMGPTINSPGLDSGAVLSMDSRYLFFTSQRAGDQGYNPYWVSSEIIDSLRIGAG